MRVLVVIGCLLCLCSWTDKPIRGYEGTESKNQWVLGHSVKDDAGFYTDGIYLVDKARVIQFNGVDTIASVVLSVTEKMIDGIMIVVSEDEKSWDSLFRYYRDRYGDDFDLVTTEQTNHIVWEDKRNLLILSRDYDDPEGFSTVIQYRPK